jgi:hypothetical protein
MELMGKTEDLLQVPIIRWLALLVLVLIKPYGWPVGSDHVWGLHPLQRTWKHSVIIHKWLPMGCWLGKEKG